MLRKKVLACLLVISLILGMFGLPALANATNEVTPTATSVSGLAPQQLDSSQDSGGQDIGDQGDSDGQTEPGSEGSANKTNKPAYVPLLPAGTRPCPQDNDGAVLVDVDENVDILVDSKAKAVSGNAVISGTAVTNDVSGESKAIALGPSGEPVEQGQYGTLGKNDVIKLIENLGNAEASLGLAQAGNTMDNNTVQISSDKTVETEVLGEIVNSNITVNAVFNYWAAITGLADASSGNGDASGLLANNSIDSNDKAVARGDAPSSSTEGFHDGSALAVNDAGNTINNKGDASVSTGNAGANNRMLGNDIKISPVVKVLIDICGDIVNSDVTINLVYNFWAVISGIATAITGESSAVGTETDNGIGNSSSAKAVGDAPSSSAAGNASSSDGSAIATNDTSNKVSNKGTGLAASGNATSLNSMINNDIVITPVIKSGVEILNDLVDANVVINVVYNFWAAIFGEANAETGDAYANGLATDNSIKNSSESLALGDSAGSSDPGSTGRTDGQAIAANNTNNAISNTGDAASTSGNSAALNKMLDNSINISPLIATVVMIVHPVVDDLVTVDIVFDVWSKLAGSANATTGDAYSAGAITASSINSRSDATALAEVSVDNPDGSATALNSSDNKIASNGIGKAATGSTGAMSVLSNARISIIGCIDEELVVDKAVNSFVTSFVARTEVQERADARSGDVTAVGVVADSAMKSRASSKDVFGDGVVSKNDSDDDIANVGEADASSGNATAITGKTSTGNTENVILIGFGIVTDEFIDKDGQINKTDVADENLHDNQSGSNPESTGGNSNPGTDSGGTDGSNSGLSGNNVAYADFRQEGHRPNAAPIWMWLVFFGLFAGWIGFTFTVKPWKPVNFDRA